MRLLSAAAIAAALVLAACTASTRLVTNERVSDTVKAKSFKAYREVLFIPPREDKREVVPRVVREIERMGFKVTVLDPTKPVEAPQGTGFVIGAD